VRAELLLEKGFKAGILHHQTHRENVLINPFIEAAAGAALIALGGGLWWAKQRSRPQVVALRSTQVIAPAFPEAEIANRIIVGLSPDQPAFELALFTDDVAFDRGTPMSKDGGLGLMSRMSACLQAAPSLLVQQAHQGRLLMEVAINSPLANAANGSHFLPFARGASGKIIEQAKLFKPEGLSSLVNAAAVWQVASVVVAQKHLADISAKLDEIKQGIDDLKGMFQDKLDGDIEGTYRYLRTVARSFQKGVVPTFARSELESCRRELLQTESGLIKMFERCLQQNIEHKETVGTEDLLSHTLSRYSELEKINNSLMTCFRTEALAWHVLSLFPGEEAYAQIWKEETVESVIAFVRMQDNVKKTSKEDVSRIKSAVNWESTLKARREQVRLRADRVGTAGVVSAHQLRTAMAHTTLRLEHNDDAIRLGVEFINGQIQDVRVLA
jgi:hypothetical protein